MARVFPAESPDDLLARAEDYACFSMRTCGKVPPSLIAVGPSGSICYMPSKMANVRAKDDFANVARLICVAHAATAAVIILEAWMKVAGADGLLNLKEPPSEALNRREIVVLNCETRSGCKQRILPIIRTDAGGFFGFGEYAGPADTRFEGRFTQILPPKILNKEWRAHACLLLETIGIDIAHLRRDPFAN
jgi:hypothetical protein